MLLLSLLLILPRIKKELNVILDFNFCCKRSIFKIHFLRIFLLFLKISLASFLKCYAITLKAGKFTNRNQVPKIQLLSLAASCVKKPIDLVSIFSSCLSWFCARRSKYSIRSPSVLEITEFFLNSCFM